MHMLPTLRMCERLRTGMKFMEGVAGYRKCVRCCDVAAANPPVQQLPRKRKGNTHHVRQTAT